jgi:titin
MFSQRNRNRSIGLTKNALTRRPLRLEALEDRVTPSTFLVTNTSDSGTGSLREAIINTNNNPGIDTIAFNIGGTSFVKTIRPASPLPAMTGPVVIDGSSQPNYGGYPRIEISGNGAGSGANGLVFEGGGSTIVAIVVNGFSGNGIVFKDGDGNVLYDCYIGLRNDALAASPNGTGIFIDSSNNRIGGGNFITYVSGNTGNGVHIQSGTGNVIKTSFIGTGLTGYEKIGNGAHGVYVASNSNSVGTTGGQANVISGNGGAGVYLAGNSNTLFHCNIGANQSGLVPMGNTEGVIITGSFNFVGGSIPQSNLIGGNRNNGLYITGKSNTVQANSIGDDITGLGVLPNTNGITIEGGTDNIIGGVFGVENVISGNLNVGLYMANAYNNRIEGNNFGADDPGNAPMPNRHGIYIVGGGNNTIGGTGPVGNVVVSNLENGLYIANSRRNKIQGNLFGTLPYASGLLGNYNGVYIASGANNVIGGTVSTAGNFFNGNRNHGLYIGGTGTVVQNNNFGYDGTASAAYGNLYGVYIAGSNNTIGGTATGAGNRFSANSIVGLYIAGNGNTIQSNTIGTTNPGTPNLANGTGVFISGSSNTIGGTGAGVLNVIAGNTSDGIRITGNNNVVKTNIIGDYVQPFGFPGNFNGIVISGNGNVIGGTTNSEYNFIGYNDKDGVVVDVGDNNPIRGNSIYGHPSGLGIRLTSGGNNSQAAPVITQVTKGGPLIITGVAYGPANSSVTVDFYELDTPHPSGNGEGDFWRFSQDFTTNSSGVANFSFTSGVYMEPGNYVSATTTSGNNTSAFSNASVIIQLIPPVDPPPSVDTVTSGGANPNQAPRRSQAGTGISEFPREATASVWSGARDDANEAANGVPELRSAGAAVSVEAFDQLFALTKASSIDVF